MCTVDGARDHLFPTHTECPSDLALDRLHLGELASENVRGVRAHIDTCARCRERVAMREAGLSAFGVDSERVISKIETALASETETAPNVAAPVRKKRHTWIALASAATVAVLWWLLVLPPRNAEDEIYRKGSFGLTVFREREGKVERAVSGDSFRAHDRLRFSVELPRETKQIMIVGVEQGGAMFPYYPADGTQSSREPKVASDGALIGAIELDESPADERIHLVACPREFAMGDLKAGAQPDYLDIPNGCKVTAFTLEKEQGP